MNETQKYILCHLDKHPKDIVKVCSERFDISRQAAHKHLKILEEMLLVKGTGNTQGRQYHLTETLILTKSFAVDAGLEESGVWNEYIDPLFHDLPQNVYDIWHHGFTEMFNNALEHSEAKRIVVNVYRIGLQHKISILDDGVGIFQKIVSYFNYHDERQAIFELYKGKLTTSPSNHSGEGIFFTRRAFDTFELMSGDISFQCRGNEKWNFITKEGEYISGTKVVLELSDDTETNITDIFDQFASEPEFVFNRTIVPVKMLKEGRENLISRSQAKRLLLRIDQFEIILFDFDGVDMIGQAFADEVFRVYAKSHPNIILNYTSAAPIVEKMIRRSISASKKS